MDLNKVMIIGRLTRDPELKTIPSGASVCQMSIATGYSYTNKDTGQKVEQTEFHNVVLWRKLAEIAAQYLKKGAQVYIEGRLQTRNWEGTDGKKNYRTEIIGENLIMLGKPGNGSSTGGQGSFTPQVQAAKPPNNDFIQTPAAEELPTIQQGEDINVEDIPF